VRRWKEEHGSANLGIDAPVVEEKAVQEEQDMEIQ
jgi:hypothetical protein